MYYHMYTSFTVNRITKGSGLYELAVLSHKLIVLPYVVTMATSLVMGCVAIAKIV